MTVAALAAAMNTDLASSGITATASEGNIVFASELGDTITIASKTAANVVGYVNADGSTTAAGGATVDVVFTGNLHLTNTAGGEVKFGTQNATDTELTATLAKLGMTLQGDSVASASSDAVSVATSASASAAITAIDAALEKVFESRGDLGAFQNRLDHTVSNLRNVSENTSFSKSQIQDTDFATESANLAKAQVLQQAGTAMLAQANASGQSVLSLLK
jgi:flagellin